MPVSDELLAEMVVLDSSMIMGLPPITEIAEVIPPCAEPCDHISCDMQREVE